MKVLVLPPWLTGRSEPWLPSCLCCNPAAAVECMQHTRTQTSWAPEEVDSINSGPSCPMRARRPSLPPQLLAQHRYFSSLTGGLCVAAATSAGSAPWMRHF